MTRFLFLIFLIIPNLLSAQLTQEEIIQSNEAFREKINHEYTNQEESPLKEEDRQNFKGLPFYDINPAYCVEAKFKRVKKAKPFTMQTTGPRKPTYEIYGVARFKLNGQKFKLNIYQSHRLRTTEEYKDYLFLPFTDLTNSETTYGGGRYIDLRIPTGKTIILDFNQAYNPYCAYNTGFSCPIVPSENFLDTEVKAGVRYE